MNTKNLTEGSPSRLLLFFSLPLMMGNIFQQLYTVVDTAVVGTLGVNALAALGTVEWLNWLALGMIQGFTQGFCILMAQRFGAQDYKGLRRVVTNSLFLSVLCAIALTFCCEGLIGTATKLCGFRARSAPWLSRISASCSAVSPLSWPTIWQPQSSGHLATAKRPFFAMVVAAFTNIGLDFLFVMGFGWGVEGAAIATLIAQCLSAVYCFFHLRKIQILKLSQEDWTIEKPLCLHLMGLGLPMAFQNSVIAVGGMIVQMIVNGFGVAFIAGLTATNRLYELLEVAATSYGYAMVTYTSRMRHQKLPRISKGLRAALMISTITSLLIALVMLVFGRLILSCFISMDAAESMAALDIGYRYLAIMSVFLPILYVLHVTRSCIQGLGNTLLPMVSGIAGVRHANRSRIPASRPCSEKTGFSLRRSWPRAGADLILIPSYFYMIKKVRRTHSCSDCGEKSGKITI